MSDDQIIFAATCATMFLLGMVIGVLVCTVFG